MQITKYQRSRLLRARDLRDKPLSLVSMMLLQWKGYLLMGLGVTLLLFSWWKFDTNGAAPLISIGFVLGTVVRDIRWIRANIYMRPVNIEITDWSKVDSLLIDGKSR